MDPPTFDPTPAEDEAQWLDTERGLDARHKSKEPRAKSKEQNGSGSPLSALCSPLPPVCVKLEVALSPAVATAGYAPRYLPDVVLNTSAQRGVLKLLTASLQAHEEVLLDGTSVRHPQQAIQWLLEKLAVGLPQPVLDRIMAGVEW